MEKQINKKVLDEKKKSSKSANWSLVSISGIISLTSIIIITLVVLFAQDQMLIASWIITALAIMGIAMAGAVIKS